LMLKDARKVKVVRQICLANARADAAGPRSQCDTRHSAP
jgi:hypothetical protein